jgi:hypothetical protein
MCVLACGCGQGQPLGARPAPAPPPAVPGPRPPDTLRAGAITEAEARQFAARLTEIVVAGDTARASEVFDFSALFERGIEGVPLADVASTRDGFLEGVQRSGGIIGEVHTQVSSGGSYMLLRVRPLAGQTSALFRMLLPEGSVNYHDMLLTRTSDGRVMADDVYVHLAGERASATVHRLFLQLAASENRSIVDRLTGRQQVLARHVGELEQMIRAVKQQVPLQALDVYNRLPAELRQEKFLMLIRLRAAMESGVDEEYMRAMKEFRAAHREDPAVDFISIDYHLLRSEFDSALAATDQVDGAVGGDPFLDSIRSNILTEAKRYEPAMQAARRAIAGEPALPGGYWSLITAAIGAKDFSVVLETLQQLDRQFEMEWNDLEVEPLYADFVASTQHREWLAYLKSKR